jgi:single-strand DNA-binding protein
MKDLNSLNKVILVGRVGKKPEIRYSAQTQRPVARFTLATNEVYFNKTTNEKIQRTEWHKVYMWGPLAEFASEYLTIGRLILVEGKLRSREWQDRNGIKRTTTEIEAQSVVLLGRREEVSEIEEPVIAPEIPEEFTPEPIVDETPPDEEPPF